MAVSVADIESALHATRLADVVVVDALNYLSNFVPIEGREGSIAFGNAFAPARFREMKRRVAAMAAAADVSNVKLIWIFDNGQATEEALKKWKERRLNEVKNAKRNMPLSAETALYAALEQAGFLVLSPRDIDGDDAVALLAWHLGAKVLSCDRDLLRYQPELPRSRVFRDFGIHNGSGRLLLSPQGAPLPDGTESRDLYTLKRHLPDDCSDAGLQSAWGLQVPIMCTRGLVGSARRGNADSLTAECGNLNAHALGLIASVYSALGVPSTGVAFTFPAAMAKADDKDAFKAELVTTTVVPDACVAKRIVAKCPELAKQWLEATAVWPQPHEGDKSDAERKIKMLTIAERAHAVCMIAAEIADAMLYAVYGAPNDHYSSPQRILAMYERLAQCDARLDPDKFEYVWWSEFDDATKAMFKETFMPDTSVPAEHIKREDPREWCDVVECRGLNWNSSPGCKAVRGHGWCFRASIAHGRAKGKTPLCQACVTFLSTHSPNRQRRSPTTTRRPPGWSALLED